MARENFYSSVLKRGKGVLERCDREGKRERESVMQTLGRIREPRNFKGRAACPKLDRSPGCLEHGRKRIYIYGTVLWLSTIILMLSITG